MVRMYCMHAVMSCWGFVCNLHNAHDLYRGTKCSTDSPIYRSHILVIICHTESVFIQSIASINSVTAVHTHTHTLTHHTHTHTHTRTHTHTHTHTHTNTHTFTPSLSATSSILQLYNFQSTMQGVYRQIAPYRYQMTRRKNLQEFGRPHSDPSIAVVNEGNSRFYADSRRPVHNSVSSIP